MRSTVLVLVFLISACAGPQYAWVKADFSQTQFEADRYRCQQEATAYAAQAGGQMGTYARSSNKGILMSGLFGEQEINYQGRFSDCMALAGYRLQEVK